MLQADSCPQIGMVGNLSDAIMLLPCVSSRLCGCVWFPVMGKKEQASFKHFLVGPQYSKFILQSVTTNTLPMNSGIQYAFTFIMSFAFPGQYVRSIRQLSFSLLDR